MGRRANTTWALIERCPKGFWPHYLSRALTQNKIRPDIHNCRGAPDVELFVPAAAIEHARMVRKEAWSSFAENYTLAANASPH